MERSYFKTCRLNNMMIKRHHLSGICKLLFLDFLTLASTHCGQAIAKVLVVTYKLTERQL